MRAISTNTLEIKIGKIDTSLLKIPPGKREYETARFYSLMGKDIVFLKPSNIPGVHTPDILLDGVEWEIKCPEGSGKRTIENILKKAEMQSQYIIIDLRWIKIPEKQCLSQIRLNFITKPRIKRLSVITKNGLLIEFPEKH